MQLRQMTLPFVFLAFAGSPLAADEVCTIKAAVRCACRAEMLVACQSGRNGFVDNDERARSLTLSVVNPSTGQKREVLLTDPPAGIRSYYGTLNDDTWVAAQLDAQGLTKLEGLVLNVKTIRFADDVALYDDPSEQDVAPGK